MHEACCDPHYAELLNVSWTSLQKYYIQFVVATNAIFTKHHQACFAQHYVELGLQQRFLDIL